MAESNTKEEYALAITSLRNGAARAIIDSQSSYPDASQRANVLSDTARLLFQLRHYDQSSELAKAAQRINNTPFTKALAELTAKIKPQDEEVYPASDPRYPVRRLLFAALSDQPDLDVIRKLFTESARDAADRTVAEIRKHAAGLRSQYERLGLSPEIVVDSISGAADLQKDGDDASGYRINTPFGSGYTAFIGFVVKEGGEYRVLASQDQLAPVGQLVQELLRAGDLKSAQRWLDRIVSGPAEVEVGRNGGVVHSAVVRNIWSGTTEEGRSAATARIAAATLVAQFAASDSAINILKDARKTSTNRVDRGNIELALCDAYEQTRQWAEMLAMARQLEGNYAVSQFAFRYVVESRTALKQWKELEQDAQVRLKTVKENEEALRAGALAAMAGHDWVTAAQYLKSLMAQEWVGTDSRILNGWNALLNHGSPDDALKHLEGHAGGDEGDPAYHYVTGLLQALAGKPEDAQRSLLNGVAKDSFAMLDSKPWVLLGKIQELYGLSEGASRAYARARAAKRVDESSDWALALVTPATKASQ